MVIFDGIFSMRGDNAPLAEILGIAAEHEPRFRDGVVTMMDDSHGIAAYGATGRGTEEHCGGRVDVLVGTFGKAFGVNGGFVAGSPELIEAVRQKADTYIYTNPLGAADCAAATAAVTIADAGEGRERLANLKARTAQFRAGLRPPGAGVDSRTAPGRAAARARHGAHPRHGPRSLRPWHPRGGPHFPGGSEG